MTKITEFFGSIDIKTIAEVFGLIGIILLGLVVWAYILAHYGIFVSFVKSGEIVLVEMGKSFYKLIPNVPNYGLKNNQIAQIKDDKGNIDKGVKTSKSIIGIFWVGFYPIQKIHKYPFKWDKSISKSEIEEEKEKGGIVEETSFGIISHRSETVSTIRYKNIYPIILTNLEMAGQIKVDISFEVIFESVDPVFSVFILNGKWFEAATSAFNGIISDSLKGMELRRKDGVLIGAETFEEIEKESFFNDEVVLPKNDVICKSSGMKIAKVIYKDYAISGSEEAIAAAEGLKIAELNKETERVKGEAEGAKLLAIEQKRAEGIKVVKGAEAEGIRMVKKAEADMLLEILKSAKEHSQGGDVAIAKEYADAIRQYEGSTLIFGSSNISPMIPVDNNKDNKKKGG